MGSMQEIFEIEKEKELVQPLDLQSGFCLMAKRRAILLANHLLDEEGKIQNLESALDYLQGNDAPPMDHFLQIISLLQERPEHIQKIESFGLPVCDPQIEEWIAATLQEMLPLSDRHVIWAIFSALLCPLRQNIGSCFATAPAILVQAEQIGQFLEDMQSLLAKGMLSRTLEGTEYIVPISPSPGLGHLDTAFLENLEKELLEEFDLSKKDLSIVRTKLSPKLAKIEAMEKALKKAKAHHVAYTDHLLLKVWEFTLASFVDVKKEFSSWNLYDSLGLHAEERGGIGALIYSHLDEKLKNANEKLDEHQLQYEIAFDQVRASERLLSNATSEAEIRRLRAEHQGRLYHMRSTEGMRDNLQATAQNIANLFTYFIDSIAKKFQEYFQEIYDGEMRDPNSSQYEDSAAGFRLLYKHGRTHVGAWTFIHTKEEYLKALKEFFLSVENPISETCQWEEGKRIISHLTTAIIHHLDTEEFLKSASFRMEKARGPNTTPWAYISGGTLTTLLHTYFRREGTLTEEKRWVESAQDLLIFLLETLKSLPPFITDSFLQNRSKRMLMTSPNHVFSLLPGTPLFQEGWQDRGFTYTWVRDQIIIPSQKFYNRITIDPSEQIFLVQTLANTLSLLEGHELQRDFRHFEKPLSIPAFHNLLGKQVLPALVDSFLFEMLPLVTPKKAQEIFEEIGRDTSPHYEPMGRRQFYDLLREHLPEKKAAEIMQKKKFSPPHHLIVGDTNWAGFYFAFIFNPASEDLELWRIDKRGLIGAPMREWQSHLDGSSKNPWSLFTQPYEYTASF